MVAVDTVAAVVVAVVVVLVIAVDAVVVIDVQLLRLMRSGAMKSLTSDWNEVEERLFR